jgi:aryl-alcohol dehydrogenase-like predicted oxidoreductase
MEQRILGSSGLSVAPWALGGNVFGWTVDEQASFRLLDAFVDAGFNLIDTADVYSHWAPGNKGGESETIIGKWLKQTGKRDKIVLATKVGSDMKQGDGKTLRSDYILKEVEASLQRLQTDVIDLYQTHFDDTTLPVSEPLNTYAELIKQGKVKAIGTSNMSAERLQESLNYSKANGLPAYTTLQPEYNLYDREKYENEYEQIVTNNHLGVLNYYALASGFLSGKYRTEADASKSPRGGGIIKKYLDDRGKKILKALDEVAEQYGATPATISLAWLVARPSITAPIASSTSVEQMEELVKAFEIKLDAESVKKLDGASAY